jgi:hypothetical protein
MIKLRYSSIDGVRKTRTFQAIPAAHAYAAERVGAHPEMGSTYAISGDGIGKIEVEGCTLAELFKDPNAPPTDDELFEEAMQAEQAAERAQRLADAEAYAAEMRAFEHDRSNGCRCSDMQLTQVGCDCPASAEAFALVESYLVPDEYGGEKGARRLARSCATLAEAETAARIKNSQVEDGDDRFFLVTYQRDGRWHDDYGRRPDLAADSGDEIPF